MGEANFYYFTCLKLYLKANIHQWRTQHQPVETVEVSEAVSEIEEEAAGVDAVVVADAVVVVAARKRRTVDPRHQIGTPRERWKNQIAGGDLPLLPSYQGMRNHRLFPWL